MEKRKRNTVQIKTEISQVAAYFIDQIVMQAPKAFKSRSGFVKKALMNELCGFIKEHIFLSYQLDGDLEPAEVRYLSKSEADYLSNYNLTKPRISSIPPPEEVVKKTHPVANGSRKRYTVQALTEISIGLNQFIEKYIDQMKFQLASVQIDDDFELFVSIVGLELAVKLRYNLITSACKKIKISRSEFLNWVIIYYIVEIIPTALNYLPEKDKKRYSDFERLRLQTPLINEIRQLRQ
jgi:hypothetical protein